MNMAWHKHICNRWKIAVMALALAALLAVGPLVADATLHTGFVPAALAEGPQRGSGG
jgi:hypothetical protein